MSDVKDVNLIVTDLHHRITGVSATVRTLVPYVKAEEPLALVSTHSHSDTTPIGLLAALRMCLMRPRDKPFRIWHVRRNNEMLWALVFKHLFRCPIKLVMTSCALRRHSWFPRKLLGKMDAIIATSSAAAEYVEHVAATIPHGVDCQRFRPAMNRAAAWNRLGLPGKFGISICGRIRPEKGTDLFVNAMVELLPKYPEFTACIVGRVSPGFESFQNRLRQKVESAGLAERIVWVGELSYEQMPEFHGAMSLCVAPARYEGFGLVPLEAMACGVPVVASRTGCYPEAIVPGENGELVACDDLAGLEQALQRVMSSPNRLLEMGEFGCRRVNEQFSAELEASRIVDVYHRMWAEAA